MLRWLIQFQLNALIRNRRFVTAYLLLFLSLLADPRRSLSGAELEIRKNGLARNSTLRKFCPPQMFSQLLVDSGTYSSLLKISKSFNLMPASFVKRLKLLKTFVYL